MKNIGRPVKEPDTSALNQLGHFTFIVDDVRAILKECKAPAHWGDNDLGLILEFFGMPGIIDATWKPKTKFEREFLLPANTMKAIQWAKLFAEAPQAMIDALPKISKRLNRFVRSPESKVVWFFCHRRDAQRFTGKNDFCQRFWTDKSDALACELNERFGSKKITSKIVEHARCLIRKKLSPKT